MNLELLQQLKSKHVGVLGLGVNNLQVTAFLVGKGAQVTVRDRNVAVKENFAKNYPDLVDKIEWEIGERILLNLKKFDLILRSPSIPYLTHEIQQAGKAGVEISSQTKLFFELCPAKIIGITGTKGKGTTATLTYQLLKFGYKKGNVYLAGNIGLDPFQFIEDLNEEDLVILELSSFQLQDLTKSPQIAVVLNVTPDHLNHHQNFNEYLSAKSNILKFQKPEDLAIINLNIPANQVLPSLTPAKVMGIKTYIPSRESAWVDTSDEDEVVFLQRDEEMESFSIKGRKLLGAHNLENILPSALIAYIFEVPTKDMQRIIKDFVGLEHRLSFVGRFAEVDFYNDSIATTPETCLVAMQTFAGRRIHLLAGGLDKGQDYSKIAFEMVERCATISILPGQASPRLIKALKKAISRTGSKCLILDKAGEPWMPKILSGIQPHLRPGDVVLLAPTASTYGGVPFANYKERGESFTLAVKERYGSQI